MKKEKRFFCLRFKDIENIIWEAIIKYQDDGAFSDTWLRSKLTEFEKQLKEVK